LGTLDLNSGENLEWRYLNVKVIDMGLLNIGRLLIG
jgi:hypothetical protein